MTSLLEEIRGISEELAGKLENAGYYSDSDIKSLNREDLQELLPGEDKLRLRKTVFDIISRFPTPQSSIRALLEELKNFIPDEAFRDALTNNGPLLQYLNFLKELRRGEPISNNIQEFLDAHIDLLDSLKMNLAEKPSEDLCVVAPPPLMNDTAAPPVEGSFNSWNPFSRFNLGFFSQSQKETAPNFDHPTNNSTNQVTQNTSSNTGQTQPRTEATVTYRCIVSGKTLDKHLDLLKKLKGHVPGPDPVSLCLREVQHDEQSQVIIVFCPVVSRVGTDAEAALSSVSSDKPIILVMMHHVHTARSLPAPGPYPSVVLGVSVFFHETVRGLLQCNENVEAISAIQTKLLEYSSKKNRIC